MLLKLILSTAFVALRYESVALSQRAKRQQKASH